MDEPECTTSGDVDGLEIDLDEVDPEAIDVDSLIENLPTTGPVFFIKDGKEMAVLIGPDRFYELHRAEADGTAATEELDELTADLREGNLSDGHHTHNELYAFRMALHAFAARYWRDRGYTVVKSRRHHDGKSPFDGGWFIVTVELPTGQASNHYREEFWDLFDVREAARAPEWDGHTPQQSLARMIAALEEEGKRR